MTTAYASYLSEAIRSHIEERFYALVNEQSRFEQLCQDPTFLPQITTHVGLFSDHGVVHARDVAGQILDVLSVAAERLLPPRSDQRQAWMRGYGVLVAYWHDIGMQDFSTFGRKMHAEFASQAAFDPAHDDLIDAIWDENSGNVAWRLLLMHRRDQLESDPKVLLRELLALAVAHSKSKVPVGLLNDRPRLRQKMLASVGHDLRRQFWQQRAEKTRTDLSRLGGPGEADGSLARLRQQLAEAEAELDQLGPAGSCADEARRPHLDRLYGPGDAFARRAFAWLEAPGQALTTLADDVIDVLRCLRCADALRQRGSVLYTSGGHEIYVSRDTGNAVYALRLGAERLFLLELPVPESAGEANVASSGLDPNGDLRLVFTRGAYRTAEVQARAAGYSAQIVHDIQRDVLASFNRPPDATVAAGTPPHTMRILLEEPHEAPEFARLVRHRLATMDPALAPRLQVVPALDMAPDGERNLYLQGREPAGDQEQRREWLAQLGRSGHRVADIEVDKAFAHVRLVIVPSGGLLIQADTVSAFVYVPLEEGLRVIPLGGYQAFMVPAWMPLGATGVIRGARRNATVVAERRVRLLMIPGSVYLRQWHQTHTPASLAQALKSREAAARSAGYRPP